MMLFISFVEFLTTISSLKNILFFELVIHTHKKESESTKRDTMNYKSLLHPLVPWSSKSLPQRQLLVQISCVSSQRQTMNMQPQSQVFAFFKKKQNKNIILQTLCCFCVILTWFASASLSSIFFLCLSIQTHREPLVEPNFSTNLS